MCVEGGERAGRIGHGEGGIKPAALLPVPCRLRRAAWSSTEPTTVHPSLAAENTRLYRTNMAFSALWIPSPPQLRQIQLQIKSEEDSLRDHQRATIKARAEALAAGRAAEAEARNTAKAEYGERRKQVC